MAFRSGPVLSIGASPASGYFSYRLGGGSDQGAIFAMADSDTSVELQVSFPAKKREADGSTTYFVLVTNLSSTATRFELQGGGVT